MTFLATGEDTQGQFALIEGLHRKGNAPPPHIIIGKMRSSMPEGELTVSVGDRTMKAVPGTMVFLPRNVQHSFTIESEQGGCSFFLLLPDLKDGSRISACRRRP